MHIERARLAVKQKLALSKAISWTEELAVMAAMLAGWVRGNLCCGPCEVVRPYAKH